jgi:hypothetical protein
MTRYFMHIRGGRAGGDADDLEGVEHPDPASAREDALLSIREVLADEVARGFIDLRGVIEVTDSSGKIAATVRFVDALTVTLPKGWRSA